MSTLNRTILDQAIQVLLDTLPVNSRWGAEQALERNLYFPLKRCLQFRSDLCAGFPDCMCGRDVLEQTCAELGVSVPSLSGAANRPGGGPGPGGGGLFG